MIKINYISNTLFEIKNVFHMDAVTYYIDNILAESSKFYFVNLIKYHPYYNNFYAQNEHLLRENGLLTYKKDIITSQLYYWPAPASTTGAYYEVAEEKLFTSEYFVTQIIDKIKKTKLRDFML